VQYYPVYLDLRGRPCVVVGGGEVAERKVEGLLAAGARVTVVSPTLSRGLAALADTHEILHHGRPYRRGDLAGAVLAYAATDDEQVHAEIAAEAAAARVPLNVVDRPRLCGFIAPATVTRGPVQVAISTGGASPALAKRLRRELEAAVGPEYALAATILGKLRARVGDARAAQPERARVFTTLVESPLLDALRARDADAVDAILERVVGPGATLSALGVVLGDAGPRSA
jgi:precorrin-2 dehydrogenase/sirohydrochlorin ferrochelatase